MPTICLIPGDIAEWIGHGPVTVTSGLYAGMLGAHYYLVTESDGTEQVALAAELRLVPR